MKTNRLLGVVATALTALACALPNVVRAAGDIWSIEPYQDEELVTRDFSATKDDPLKAGDEFKIRVRLLNRNWATSVGDKTYMRPWTFAYVGTPGGEPFANFHMPKLGVWVSGKLKYAEIEGTPTPAAPLDRPDCYFFTDLIFKYKVEAGDIALPLRLANPTGTGPIEADDLVSGQYLLQWGLGGPLDDWQLQNADGDVCSFTFTDEIARSPLTPPMPNTSWDFSNPPIYVQAIDFDSNFASNGVWRQISSGLDYSSPIDPTVVIPGGNAATKDLYVWTKDTNVAEVVVGGNVHSVTTLVDEVSHATYRVGTLRIPAGNEKVSFKIQAAQTVDKTTEVYLCDTPTNIYNASQVLITNFLTRVVEVVTPPPPFISVVFADGSPNVITADGDYKDFKTSIKVKLSQAYTNSLKVVVTPTVANADASAEEPWHYIDVSTSPENATYSMHAQEVVIDAGKLESDLLYVYALAADSWTRNLANGILFTPSVSDEAAIVFFEGTSVEAKLQVNVADPVVEVPDAPYTGTKSIQIGEMKTLSILLDDSYRNMTGTYSVYLNENDSFTGTEEPVATDLVPVDGVIKFNYTYSRSGAGIVSSWIKVKNSSGLQSAPVSFEANLLAARAMRAEPYGQTSRVYGEGETAQIMVKFEPAFTKEKGYVFLEPANELTRQVTRSERYMYGAAVGNGDTELALPLSVELLDGTLASASAGLEFNLKLRTDADITQGNPITGYPSPSYSITVTNRVPSVRTVRMGVWEPEVEYQAVPGTETVIARYVMPGKAAVDVDKLFQCWADDGEVFADLTNENFVAKWTFYDGVGYSTNIYGNPNTTNFTYAFTQTGRQRVTVELQDKDMGSEVGGRFGPRYEFYVDVVDQPSVLVVPADGVDTIREDALEPKFFVRLTQAPDQAIDVKVEVTALGGGVLPVLSQEVLHFRRGQDENFFTLSALDGTDEGYRNGYKITAKVITTDRNGDGKPYNEVYLPCDDFRLRIQNVPPRVVMPDESIDTNRYTTAVGREEVISWKVTDDGLLDLKAGLTVTIDSDEGPLARYSGKFFPNGNEMFITNFAKVTFNNPGNDKWVSVNVTDKDGASSGSQKRYFRIAPAKAVKLFPERPSLDSQSRLTQAYVSRGMSSGGLGYGRVWMRNNTEPTRIDTFCHQWAFATGYRSVELCAWGYPAGCLESAGLCGGQGFPVTPTGSKWNPETGGPTYQNPETTKDSFLYTWILDTSEEGGNLTGSAQFAPQYGPAVIKMSQFTLPEDEDDAVSYPDTVVEALFSKEWRVADNLGDFNQDGIPDYYAHSAYDAGVLYTVLEQAGSSSGNDQVDVSDLRNAANYNGDEDYLPLAAQYSNPLNPSTPGWGPNPNAPFKAIWEIRGLHDGLNEPGISDPDFSQAETFALLRDYAKSEGASMEMTAENLAAARAWATNTSWATRMPARVGDIGGVERRLDPTSKDSDEDGLDDGYEYFFWYYAKAGVMINGTWQRLTGSRFNPANVGQGTPITSEEIAWAFDPLIKHADTQSAGENWDPKDFDGDGLMDLEEYALGTNPVNWDSDGDGVSDLYEIMAGTDPLDSEDGVGGTISNGVESYSNRAKGNPDGDYMAYALSEEPWTVVKAIETVVADGKTNSINHVYGLPVAKGGIKVVKAEGDAIPMYSLKVYSKLGTSYSELYGEVTSADAWGWVEYYVEELPLLVVVKGETEDKDEAYLVDDVKAWKTIVCGDPAKEDTPRYIGESVMLRAGTLVSGISEQADAFRAESAGFKTGLELFRYGSDANGVWAPVPVDGQWMEPPETDMEGNEKEKKLEILSWQTDVKIAYLHHQVNKVFGYDPRTAWFMTANGKVSDRWNSGNDSAAGDAVNTKPYTTRDEYLLLQYRHSVTDVVDVAKGKVLCPFYAFRWKDQDLGSVLGGGMSIANLFLQGTTKPTPGGDEYSQDVNVSGDGSTEINVPRWNSDVHGADTDSDGIPDGWELYVNLDPHKDNDASQKEIKLKIDDLPEVALTDNDGLTSLQEFAGVDSCDAYKDVPSIYENHPGIKSGWWNKFFPTNPQNVDTDGDGIRDEIEGGAWASSDSFWYGRHEYTKPRLTFIFDTDTSKGEDGAPNPEYDENKTSHCFRGGGLNPCAVDTDGDLLPDAFEWQFAGVVVDPSTGLPYVPADVTDADWETITESLDFEMMRLSDGLGKGQHARGYYIAGGMDGTWGGDAYTDWMKKDPVTGTVRDVDWDHDGLQNYQEYLVQSLRHLRYDDAVTPLMGRYLNWGKDGIAEEVPFIGFIPMQCWDGRAFQQTCVARGYKGAEEFDFARLGYFTRPPNAWDPMAVNTKGNGLANYEDAGYRLMLPPTHLTPDHDWTSWWLNGAQKYACTDPRRWDTDNDGMDDYYELFHGLNPLLGSAQRPEGGTIASSIGTSADNMQFDVIAQIYNGDVTAWYNAWTHWDREHFAKYPTEKFDPVKYPWMIGTAECDADGDGLNNADESIFVNDTLPAASHSDPTPLWMTDSSSKNYASFVSQYYQLDPQWGLKADLGKMWGDRGGQNMGVAVDGATSLYKFAFEENEGFDTDGDFVSDATEKVKKIMDASDVLNFSDPDRRQAIWFPGDKSALVSYKGTNLRPNSYEYDLLKQFTVEAWVYPEQSGEQVILERVAYYDASTLSNNVPVVRRNFRLGIDAEGHVYGEFEGKTADSEVARVVCDETIPLDKWTHVGLAYNGATLAIYLNDVATPSKSVSATMIPANGVLLRLQDTAGDNEFTHLASGYTTVPCAFVVGAAVRDVHGMELTKNSTWDSYGSFFKGYIDEVRIWDGARGGSEIAADAYKRYSLDDVKAQRDAIFEQWVSGHTRFQSPKMLDPELLQVYNFCTLPGAHDKRYLVTEPSGFTSGVLDNVRVDGQRVDLAIGWWSELPVHSTVYNNYAVLPRIQNMVGHLPVYDGSAWDTEFWSATFGGIVNAEQLKFANFSFPNTANPYSHWNYMNERVHHLKRLQYLTEGSNVVQNAQLVAKKYEFDLRSRFVGTDDLVPLGGAFAKRVPGEPAVGMWDSQGAADAWDQTGVDTDGDGLPDWWERLHGGVDAIDWKSVVSYVTEDGATLQMTAAEAYVRDLSRGMLPAGVWKDAQGNTYGTAKVDANNDGLPDWWQTISGLTSSRPVDDVDNDQLSNYAEYLISQCFAQWGFPRVSATQARTFSQDGQMVPDYFLRVGQMYLGEMFADHDLIEDWWEDLYGVKFTSRFSYDGSGDADEDGWSVWAEARAGTNPNRISYLGVDEMTVPDYPVPVVEMTVKYNGTQPVSGKNVIVQAYRMDDTTGKPDAVWKISVAKTTGSSTVTATTANKKPETQKLIGINPMKEISLTLGPGSVVAGSFRLQLKDVGYVHNEAYVVNGRESITSTTLGGAGDSQWLDEAVDRVRPGDTIMGDIVAQSTNAVSGASTMTIGSINYQTGLVTLQMQKLNSQSRWSVTYWNDGYNVSYNLSTHSNSYARVQWTSRQSALGFPQKFFLTDPDDPSGNQTASRGRLREGKNLFIAWVENGGGSGEEGEEYQWDPGEPYGVIANVDVGWSRVTPFEIEMTDTSPSVLRINLASAVGKDDFDQVNAFTDRGLHYSYYKNLASQIVGTNIPSKAATRVRVVRSMINEVSEADYATFGDVVYDGTFNLGAHPLLTEADLLAQGLPDLDWNMLTTRWMGSVGGIGPITNVTYRIVLGDGSIAPWAPNGNNNLPVLFQNAFEFGTAQTKSVPIEPAGTVYAGQPTFRWKHAAVDANGKLIKDYPAFQLRVWSESGELVYDSGVQTAPTRDTDGVYSWTAPIYADGITPAGKVFSSKANYSWSVSMLDAKFKTPNADEARKPFRMETSGMIGTMSDYGTIQARVKYFGPVPTVGSAATLKGLVRVQAYPTPDFTGDPAGEGWVTDVATLSDKNALEVNATILGVPPGTYYVRAFIDTDGDARRSGWESWGYGNYMGTERTMVYAPQPFLITKGQPDIPVVTVYIEDTDIDNDGFPDAWEMATYGSLETQGSAKGGLFTKVNPNLKSQVEDYSSIGSMVGGEARQFAPMTLLSALAESDGLAISAAAQLLASPEDQAKPETVSVTITSFSLQNGVAIAVGSQAPEVSPGLLTVGDSAKVAVVLVASETADFANAKSATVKDIEIKANAVTNELVTPEELRKAIEDNGLGTAAFFKVRLVEQ